MINLSEGCRIVMAGEMQKQDGASGILARPLRAQ